jgi:hypothetical protein
MKFGYVVLCGGLMLSASVLAKDAVPQNEGKSLHDANCVSCHKASETYTRAERKVKDLNGLANQVQRCTTNLKLNWFDSENDAVTAYLNKEYYKFEPKASK